MTEFIWISLVPMATGILAFRTTRRSGWSPTAVGFTILAGFFYVLAAGPPLEEYFAWRSLLSWICAPVTLYSVSLAAGVGAGRLHGARWRWWFVAAWASIVLALSELAWLLSDVNVKWKAWFVVSWLLLVSCEIVVFPVISPSIVRKGDLGMLPLPEYLLLFLMVPPAFGEWPFPLPKFFLWLLALLAYCVGCARVVCALRERKYWSAAFTTAAIVLIAWALFLREMYRFFWQGYWADLPWWMKLHTGLW